MAAILNLTLLKTILTHTLKKEQLKTFYLNPYRPFLNQLLHRSWFTVIFFENMIVKPFLQSYFRKRLWPLLDSAAILNLPFWKMSCATYVLESRDKFIWALEHPSWLYPILAKGGSHSFRKIASYMTFFYKYVIIGEKIYVSFCWIVIFHT